MIQVRAFGSEIYFEMWVGGCLPDLDISGHSWTIFVNFCSYQVAGKGEGAHLGAQGMTFRVVGSAFGGGRSEARAPGPCSSGLNPRLARARCGVAGVAIGTGAQVTMDSAQVILMGSRREG